MSNAPLLSTKIFRSFLVSSMILPSWYFVCGLSSILSIVFCLRGILSSFASEANHTKIHAPVSAAMYSLSVELWVTVACLELAQTSIIPEALTNTPDNDRLVFGSAA